MLARACVCGGAYFIVKRHVCVVELITVTVAGNRLALLQKVNLFGMTVVTDNDKLGSGPGDPRFSSAPHGVASPIAIAPMLIAVALIAALPW